MRYGYVKYALSHLFNIRCLLFALDAHKSREEVAHELGTTREMLQLYFSEKVGEDFRTWRTRLRINDAKQMLLEKKDASINLIGEIAGFSDRSNFHTQFVKLVGCSPKKWRETGGQPEKTI